MTEKDVRNLYTGTAHLVHTAGVLALLLATPASAHVNDAFAVFEARCLAPMLAFAPYSGEGLRPSPSDRASRSAFWISRHGGEMSAVTFDSAPDEGRRDCLVQTTADAFPQQFEAWIVDEVAAGRFEADGDQRWLTVHQVEPRLAIEFDVYASGASVRLIETNLES